MLGEVALQDILFLDIETVPQHSSFNELSIVSQELWDEKTQYLRKEQTAIDFYQRAGIWAEFGKIICISVGYFKFENENGVLE